MRKNHECVQKYTKMFSLKKNGTSKKQAVSLILTYPNYFGQLLFSVISFQLSSLQGALDKVPSLSNIKFHCRPGAAAEPLMCSGTCPVSNEKGGR